MVKKKGSDFYGKSNIYSQGRRAGFCTEGSSGLLAPARGHRQTADQRKSLFHRQRVVFLASGLVGTDKVSWEIALSDIQTVSPCLTPPFFPFGVKMILKNGDTYLLGIIGRNKYVQWISEHLS